MTDETTPEGTPADQNIAQPAAGETQSAISPEESAPEAAPATPAGPGPMVASGSRVVLIVSNGPAPIPPSAFVEMPEIVGQRQGDALSLIQDTELSAQVFNDYSLTVERGRVMAQRPAPGASVPVGSEVVLLVSSGEAASLTKSVPLPNLVGLAEGEAITKLQAAGLSPQVVRAPDANVPAGIVVAQLPDELSLAALPQRRRSTAWIWIVTAIVLALVLGGLFFYYRNQPLPVPNVVGLSQAQAEDAISSAGFEVAAVVPTQTVSAAEIGNVVTQTPSPDTEAKRGSGITITVSGGQALTEVPDVTGKKQADAEKTLTDAGFQVSLQKTFSASVAKGSVVSQSPAAGQQVPEGTTVGISISEGAQNVTVPGVIGQSQSAAADTLKGAGLSSQSVQGFHDSVAKGQVYGQVPTAGTSLQPGTIVGLLVSSGPAPSGTTSATVPATIGQSRSDAEQALKAVGLTGVSILWSGTGQPNNEVVDQLPDAGTVVARNASVILIVSNGK